MELKFKILNKSKDGIVVDFKKKGKVKLTWDKFNQKFIITEDGFAEFNEVEMERIKKEKLERKSQQEAENKNKLSYSTGKHRIDLTSAKGYDGFYEKFLK